MKDNLEVNHQAIDAAIKALDSYDDPSQDERVDHDVENEASEPDNTEQMIVIGEEADPKPKTRTKEKRFSKMTYDLAEKDKMLALERQEKQQYIEYINNIEAERLQQAQLLEQQQGLLVESYRERLNNDIERYTDIHEAATINGETKIASKANAEIAKVQVKLMELDRVAPNSNNYNNQQQRQQPLYPAQQQYNQQQTQQQNPLVTGFYQRNPEIVQDFRYAQLATTIDNKLAENFQSRGLGHLVGSNEYMHKLETLYRNQFNRTSTSPQRVVKGDSPLSEAQKQNAMLWYGEDIATGAPRTQAAAEKLYREGLKALKK